jgi:hypothetical protein
MSNEKEKKRVVFCYIVFCVCVYLTGMNVNRNKYKWILQKKNWWHLRMICFTYSWEKWFRHLMNNVWQKNIEITLKNNYYYLREYFSFCMTRICPLINVFWLLWPLMWFLSNMTRTFQFIILLFFSFLLFCFVLVSLLRCNFIITVWYSEKKIIIEREKKREKD